MKAAKVFVQVPAQHKPLLTKLAEVRPVVDVDPHVTSQLAVVGERLAAVRAQVRPVTCVLRHVELQFTGAVPDLAADGTTERPVVGMLLLHMLPQLNDRRKLLTVFTTLEPTLPCTQNRTNDDINNNNSSYYRVTR